MNLNCFTSYHPQRYRLDSKSIIVWNLTDFTESIAPGFSAPSCTKMAAGDKHATEKNSKL